MFRCALLCSGVYSQAAGPEGKLRDLLGQWLPYGPALFEHLLLESGLKAVAQSPLGTTPLSAEQQCVPVISSRCQIDLSQFRIAPF
jgi:hypothetical protein